MRTSRAILTLVIVGAVLCAGRAVAVAGETPPQVVEAARLVARRFTTGVTRPAAAIRLHCRPVSMTAPAAPLSLKSINQPPPSAVMLVPGRLPIPPPIR